jgi:Domain of unknown function (DUF4166)
VVSLYRRILGEAFDALPPVLRRFHDQESGGSASGAFCVIHGKGWLARRLARLGRLPEPGSAVPVRLRVVTEGPRERWVREVGGRRLETLQWDRQGLLVEAAGPFRCGFRGDAGPEGMRLRSVRSWFRALPLPSALAPRIEAVVAAREDAWHVRVRIVLPLLGLLAGYEGEITPT